MGHLSPLSLLLCLLDVRRWRCRFDLASCGFPLNVLEHAGQVTTIRGVSGAADVGEVESWDKVAGEVAWLLKVSVRGVSVDQVLILVGEDWRVLVPSLGQDEETGELRFGRCRRLDASALLGVLGYCWEVGSLGCWLAEPCDISSIVSRSTRRWSVRHLECQPESGKSIACSHRETTKSWNLLKSSGDTEFD